ncbi:MAG: FRG domain-containing protein [Leadbetterella sp.]|nr:FRG domain-containing protein [Leadbetterella sp.]
MKVLKEIKCNSWADFKKKIEALNNKQDYVFRGQNDANWHLETSLQRFLKRLGITKPLPLGGIDPVEGLLDKYKKLINKIEKNNIFTSSEDFWGIGQHHGLTTPFLDWTKTVNKAAFFAFSDEILYNNTHSDVAVYALKVKNTHELAENIYLQNLIKERGEIKIFEGYGFSLVIPNEKLPNSRIDAQDGLFTQISGIDNFGVDLVSFFEKRIYTVYKLNKPILYKYIIPREHYASALKDIYTMSKIDFISIYPDREGCAKQVRFEAILGL